MNAGQRHRGLMLGQLPAGKRPEEWWTYERQMPRPGSDEAAKLFEMGELRGAELDEVMRDWRAHYERGVELNFSYYTGGGWLEGAAARRALHRWAGIPADLVRRWDRERQRQAKIIRRLAAATA